MPNQPLFPYLLLHTSTRPFVAPQFWRRWVLQMLAQNDRALRVMGLISMLLGLSLVVLAKSIFN